ncbi:MAG: mechanosensitive ion channel family protein [Planctomycetota bacterium]
MTIFPTTLAQAPGTPPTTTIEVDPGEVPDVEITTDESGTSEIEAQGAVGEALDEVVPATGIESVDSAVGTLTDAVGNLFDNFIAFLPQLVIALLVVIATAVVVKIVDGAALRVFRRAKLKESLRDLFRIAVRTGVWFAGLMVAAGIVFPGFGFAQLIATAGLASIAIGFAFQDIFENFFAGILILWRFPFENGDFIRCEGVEGMVEDVEIRMTRVRQADGELVLVPNSMIFKNVVRVMNDQPRRRLEVTAGIAYGEDLPTGRRVILDAVKSCGTVHDEPVPEVLTSNFGASSIDFTVIWWADPKPIDEMRSRDEVIAAIKKALDDAGIEIPFPHRTLTFSKNEPAIIRAVAGRPDAEGSPGGDQADGD